MAKHDVVKENLDSLVKLFESGNAPQAIAHITLPLVDVPSSKWSFFNQLIMLWHDTQDARGFKQWKTVGRHVKKGSKAVYILVPNIRKFKDDDGNEEKRLIGFLSRAVFKYEDTDGEALDIPDINPDQLPPLHEVATAWGIGVKYVGFRGRAYGSYSPTQDGIELATHEEQVFFHELSHAAQKRVWKGGVKGGQIPRQEIAAELSACVLARMFGRKDANEGASYKYIGNYAATEGKPIGKALWSLVSDTEKILKAIIAEAEKVKAAATA